MGEENLHIMLIGLRKPRSASLVLIKLEPIVLTGLLQEPALEVSDMRLRKVLILADEHDGRDPKLLGLMLLQAFANYFCLADVGEWHVRTWIRSSEDVNACLFGSYTQKQLVTLCSRRSYRLAGPVGDFGCSETLRVSARQEEPNCGRRECGATHRLAVNDNHR